MEENHNKQNTLFNLSKKVNLTIKNVLLFYMVFHMT